MSDDGRDAPYLLSKYSLRLAQALLEDKVDKDLIQTLREMVTRLYEEVHGEEYAKD